ncbi:hypothetical protein AUJ77_03260 [Candidatus Nomurabacteria bacterium CG1_02_43_90]|uniref:Inner membrane protein YgaP-like transmembrane domain-containing protein n=1 Tax=Candidatus Nomurabacteria bacterium CG1_02_43_90 TaxID=1805281 RepID=A0A1J4UZL5_9BACT|nr:MAG: hypothetical protein AUJ77_03260 [Candidatus Nomurabacteria bacterium CG1_02_43_90]
MNITKNEGVLDRMSRVILAELFFLGGFFWVGGVFHFVLYFLAFVMLGTAITGFCGLYKVLGFSTKELVRKDLEKSKILLGIFIFILSFIALVGSYTSNFFTKKFFLEDYATVNQFYKQALYATGQNDIAGVDKNYPALVSSYKVFLSKYKNYRPYVVSQDTQFEGDLVAISSIITNTKERITAGDLTEAHLELEKVRPLFQGILKRNGFSMLAISLVDFHDSMEKIILAADEKNSALVLDVYTEVSVKLAVVEGEVNDNEIQSIRQKLEELVTLAHENKKDALSGKAAELKSSFVKVYLKRG